MNISLIINNSKIEISYEKSRRIEDLRKNQNC